MKKIIYALCSLVFVATSLSSYAQSERNESIKQAYLRGLEYQIKAGFNIGGTAPLPLPPQIRKIESYSPNIALSISGEVTKWMGESKRWGLVVGLRLENKAMTTNALVKDYGMKIIGDDGNEVSGHWTGYVKTKVSNSYISLPVMASWQATPRWVVKAGPYIACLINGEFGGYVSEGYLREGDPTGSKVEFSDGKTANYNFSKDLRTFQWGVQLGGEWKAFKHLSVYGDLTWGLNNIFKKDFQTITFSMHPIYLNLGFGYHF